MKKQYISPVCEIMEVKIGSLLQAISTDISGNLSGGVTDGDDSDMDAVGSGGGSHTDFWGD